MKQVANFSNSNLKRNAKSLALTDKTFEAVLPKSSDFAKRFKKDYWVDQLQRDSIKNRLLFEK